MRTGVTGLTLWNATGEMRAATFNTRHGRPQRSTSVDLPGLLAAVGSLDADVVGLQELDSGTQRSNGVDQPAAIAAATGSEVRFARAIDHDGGEYGVAIASRSGIERSEVLRLDGRGEPRVALLAHVGPVDDDRTGSGSGSGTGWAVGCTHLSTRGADAIAQLRAVLHELDRFAGDRPAVLLGDLNLGPRDVAPVLAATGWVAAPSGPTHPAITPDRRIDWIVVRRGIVRDAVVVDVRASDHRPLVAELTAVPRPPTGRVGDPHVDG